jgi:RNA polymerase sigma factor (sigma-70 family)
MTAHRDALVLEHLHLVPAVARHLHLDRTRRPAAPVDRDDYLAAGREALVRAASTWEAGAGTAFATYAWTAIGWAMRAEERSMRWHRQAQPRANRTLVSLHTHHAPTGLTIADTLMDPASSHDDADLAVSVTAAVERLRPTLREVVRLCWLSDVPQKEAARRLGITQPAVAMRLQAARHVLARALGGLVEDAGEVAA